MPPSLICLNLRTFSSGTGITAMANYDQRNQNVNNQHNVNINTTEPSVEELEKRGMELFRVREYKLAIDTFVKILPQKPQLLDLNYYIALALIYGQRPKLLTFAEIQDIQRRLRNATELNRECSHGLILWAIVNEDYFTMRHIYETSPTTDDLIERINSSKPVKALHVNEMATHIHAPKNRIWELLRKLPSR